MKIKELKEEIEAKDVEVKLEGTMLTLKGKKGEVSRNIQWKNVELKVEGNNIVVSAKNATKKEKRMIYTFCSHITNMIKGIQEGHNYKLKICASHFPMNVSVSGNELIVKNFLGEKFPRKIKIKEGVKVKVEGDLIEVDSVSKELAGQTAADIEQLTKVRNRDIRIFQDGIYIINKDGKEV